MEVKLTSFKEACSKKESHLQWSDFFTKDDMNAIENAAREKLPDDYNYTLGWSTPSYANSGNVYTHVNRMLLVGNSDLLDIFVKDLDKDTQYLAFIPTSSDRMRNASDAAAQKAQEIFNSKHQYVN